MAPAKAAFAKELPGAELAVWGVVSHSAIVVENLFNGKEDKADCGCTVTANGARSYRLKKHPASGLSVMVPVKTMKRKVYAADVARLNSELL